MWHLRSVRGRLTLLYSALFFVTAAALLTVTYLLVAYAPWPGPPPLPEVPQMGSPAPEITDPDVQRADDLRRLLVWSLVTLAVMGGVALLLGWYMAGRVLRPLTTMTSAVHRMSADDLHERLAATGQDDELKRLSDTFDELLERLESSFESQRRFVANASHELRTPLAYQRTLLEVALADPEHDADALRRACEECLTTGEDQERIIEALLVLAQSQQGVDQRVEIDLADIISDVLTEHDDAITVRELHVSKELPPAPMLGDPRLMERLVTNLIDNATRHNVDGGRIEVSTAHASGHTRLNVANTGPRISEDDVAGLFEPFRRGRHERVHSGGLGLGLSIVQAIVDAHHGTIESHAPVAGGLTICVALPTASDNSP